MEDDKVKMLESIRIAVARRLDTAKPIGEYLSSSLKVDVFTDVIGDAMVAHLTGFVLADRLPPEHLRKSHIMQVYTPTSWWQFFKQQYEDYWWMRWFTKRWPVEFNRVDHELSIEFDLKRYRLYPQANFVPAKFGQPVLYHEVSEGSATWTSSTPGESDPSEAP